MNQSHTIIGWRFHHHEQLFFHANAGAPTIRLKFFQYPTYRQTVQINQPPTDCKLKKKKNNTFFVFQQKVRTKGIISLERIMSVFPQPSSFSRKETWGTIADIPWLLQRKYKQSYSYWPVTSTAIQDVSHEPWFTTNDLAFWVQEISRYIHRKITHPEKQDKRLGADQAFLTGRGDCDEFTDLFITLARIRGIPCRRLTGYFIHNATTEPEPHAWGEILSPIHGWIPVDIALHNLGNHTINYVVDKIEEFTPLLLDYQVHMQPALAHYHWERPLPSITPLYEANSERKTYSCIP
jgi:hypothetical protein